jgi:DNA-binding YbaB/EbfC family protein
VAYHSYRLHSPARQSTIEIKGEFKKLMNLPGGFDLNSMMKQAQQMQEKMAREMKDTTVDAAAGGGAVSVKMRGDFEVVSLTISPDLVKDGDVEMIQDLTLAALNEARRKVEESLKGKLGGMLPPGMM